MTEYHIHQLGQFIQTGVAEKTPHFRYPGIIADLEKNRPGRIKGVLVQMRQMLHLLVCVLDHRPELVEIKDPIPPARPLCNIKYRPLRFQLDGQSDQQEHRAQQQQSYGSHENIETPLECQPYRESIPRKRLFDPGHPLLFTLQPLQEPYLAPELLFIQLTEMQHLIRTRIPTDLMQLGFR